MPEHTVKQGECISSIAQRYGLAWEKIWNHSSNAKLKEKRKDPNTLHPGDNIFIPDKEERVESCATDQRHRFRVKGVPAKLRLRVLLDDGEPRKNETYILEVDGELFEGTTDNGGNLEHSIPPDAKKAKLLLGEEQDEYVLELGHLDPIDEITGVQTRLSNLGFDCGEEQGTLGPKTETALRAFQTKYDLTVSGEIDEATRNKLVDVHGS